MIVSVFIFQTSPFADFYVGTKNHFNNNILVVEERTKEKKKFANFFEPESLIQRRTMIIKEFQIVISIVTNIVVGFAGSAESPTLIVSVNKIV